MGSLVQLETKRGVVKDLIDKGKKILENPDKPKFLESHVSRIELGWDDTKMKAQEKVKTECDNFSEDVKFWAEYKTGIKEFAPWLSQAEVASTDGLSKPSALAEANALSEKVHSFDKACLDHLKVLETANAAAQKMTTHKEADSEVAAMRERYAKVKAVTDEWVKKVDTLVKEWALLDNTVTELNAWVAKDKTSDGENQFSLEKMESTLGELKNIFKEKEKLVETL